jgi:Cof subfamily protein (haloacid dehalogenase superfamily)
MGLDKLSEPVRPLTISAEVANRLRELIRSGDLKPGDRIPSERNLAARLGVGRPAGREALRDLKARGLLVAGRGPQGTVVAGTASRDLVADLGDQAGEGAEHLADLMELRTAVEVQAAGLAARRSSSDDRRALAAALGPAGSPLTPKADKVFHTALAQASHNPLLREIATRLGDLLHERMPALLRDLYSQPGTAETLNRQHATIVQAVDQGDEDVAREAMRRHLAFAVQGLVQLAGSGRVLLMAVIDLDGTLLSGPRHISERNRETVARVRDSGVEVILASARLPHDVAPYHKELGLSTPIIACNGALLWDLADGVPLARTALDLTLAGDIVSLARGLGAVVNIESDDEWFADRLNERIMRNVARFGLQPPQQVGTLDELLAAGGPADLVFLDIRDLGQPEGSRARDRVARSLAGRATMTESVPGLLDIVSVDASKATMARLIARSLDITADQILAVGDNENDLPLLAWAGIGVAMGNATPAVKAAADAITASNLRDGVAEALEQWILGTGRP